MSDEPNVAALGQLNNPRLTGEGFIGVDWKSTAIPSRLAVPFQLVALPGEPSDARPGNISPGRPATSRRSSDIVAFADFVSPSLRLKARV